MRTNPIFRFTRPTNRTHVARDTAQNQRGSTLLLVAVALCVMLALSALSIDVAVLYAVRAEAQKAADSAALAGARQYLTSGYTSGQMGTEVCALPQVDAAQVAAGNRVGGSPGVLSSSSCDFSLAGDPRFTATVTKTGVPVFFARIWGASGNYVSASATAEAYNGSGDGPRTQSACVKPWLMPNCDQEHSTPANPNCGGGKFLNDDGTIANPGRYPQGIVGQPVSLKPGRPSDAPAPSQYYAVALPDNSSPLCPSCSNGGGGGGASTYRQNIECCNMNLLQCGGATSVDLTLDTGNMQGPTKSGVQCLIHQNRGGSGQDILDTSSDPFRFKAGDNNPLVPAVVSSGSYISSSDSVVTLPIYDGHSLCPGRSCSPDAQVIGFLQVFVNQVDSDGTVQGTILNATGCSKDSGGGPINGGGLSPIPVRLIQPGNGS
ncbi:MAG TPA: pilus assembly protein TadG-related protein [Terriglobales bacterium]|nr:pilus assembly protein TadG-related protein [Terriglobales bacterium]